MINFSDNSSYLSVVDKLIIKFLFYIGKALHDIFFIKKKLGVYFFLPVYSMGGGERVHLEILDVSKEKKVTVYFCYHSKNDQCLNEFKLLAKCKDISKILRIKYFRHIYAGYLLSSFADYSTIFFSADTGMFFQWLPMINQRFRLILLVHWGGQYHLQKYLAAIEKIDDIVVITNSLRNELYEEYQRYGVYKFFSRVKCIRNGVYIPDVIPKKNIDELSLLYVGRNSYEKRIHLLPKIAKKTGQKINICGCNDSDFSDKWHNYIECKGLLSANDLKNEYIKSNIILISSIYEGFPLVVMEAMAYGVIPVVVNVGGLSDHIKHGINGFLIGNKNVESDLVDEFADTLIMLRKNPVLILEISNNAREYAIKEFSKGHFREQYHTLLTEGMSTK